MKIGIRSACFRILIRLSVLCRLKINCRSLITSDIWQNYLCGYSFYLKTSVYTEDVTERKKNLHIHSQTNFQSAFSRISFLTKCLECEQYLYIFSTLKCIHSYCLIQFSDSTNLNYMYVIFMNNLYYSLPAGHILLYVLGPCLRTLPE